MNNPKPSAVLFVKDLARVTAFYRDALGLACKTSDPHHAAFDVDGFRLVVHQIPPPLAADVVVGDPPQRRSRASLRLDYPVRDVAAARVRAHELGGGIDEQSPEWAGMPGFFLGFDPEGNVLGVKSAV